MSNGIKRREFLKVVGVSGAGAGIAGCTNGNVEKLLPYVVPPTDITPGVATWYTTVCGECASGCGIWARTREGRVVKLEGNPNHPISQGALCQRGHASLQGLYNPDRYAGPMLKENGAFRKATWDEAETLLAQKLQAAGANVVLIHGHTGPTLAGLFDAFVVGAGGRLVEYESLADAPLREAARITFGQDALPHYDFESARMVVSFGADFLETWLSPVEYGRGFARSSGVHDGTQKARFVAVAPRLGLTGLNADEWLPIEPGAEAAVALAMAGLIAGSGRGDAGPYAAMLAEYTPESAAQLSGISAQAIRDLADRFVSEGPTLAVGPGTAGRHRNATAANVAALILNAVAGNVGRTVHLQGWTGNRARPFSDLQQVIQRMAGGAVGVAMIYNANPVYTLPAASGFADALAKVPFKVSFATAPDETSDLADLILPDLHFLESWGDASPRAGISALQQPVMRPVPMFDGKQTGDVVLSLSSRLGKDLGAPTFHDYLKAAWGRQRGVAAAGTPAADDAWWRDALRTGLLPAAAAAGAVARPAATPTLRVLESALTFDLPALDGEGMEFTLLVYPSARVYDGRDANRPWLIEMPDPVTKIAWHSWVEMHPDDADRLRLRNGDVVKVTSPHGSVEAPIFRYPGIKPGSIAMSMGGGHTKMGRFADGNGVNPITLLAAAVEQPSGALALVSTKVGVEPTGVWYRMATIEGSDDQRGRPIAEAVELAALPAAATGGVELAPAEGAGGEHGEERHELNLGGGFVPTPTQGRPEDFPLPGSQYGEYAEAHEGPRWALAIDLDKCTGCSACIIACQAENNVPWVGENNVAMGRSMAWIRLERYYEHVDATQAGILDVRLLPVMCQHCGNAPCEPVCPVFAAYHTPEGLNAQVYNRCVGTRYCANNCPYNVRVFNWYRYTTVPEPMNWQYNPDVTVRDNGVMEKCSMCVQRIREAENRAVLEGRRPIADGEFTTACAQSCAAEAIVFGNIRDPESKVARASASSRTYRVLDEVLNTQPGVTYQRKVTFHAAQGEV